MALKTITAEEALNLLQKKLNQGQIYKYRDISKILSEGFPEINNNQIAGIISRFKKNGIFTAEKKAGSLTNYIFEGSISPTIKNSDDIKDLVNNDYKQFITKLNSYKTLVSKSEDFEFLQNKINELNRIFDN